MSVFLITICHCRRSYVFSRWGVLVNSQTNFPQHNAGIREWHQRAVAFLIAVKQFEDDYISGNLGYLGNGYETFGICKT